MKIFLRIMWMLPVVGFSVIPVLAANAEGWSHAGNKPANFESGVDQQTVYNGHPSAYLKAKSTGEGFGSLTQSFSAVAYAGRRVRFSAWVKSEGVSQFSGLWMRVETGEDQWKAFDNMNTRPIKGATAWRKYEVVLDVDEKATAIRIGIMLAGPGRVWMNSSNFEVVGLDVPTTLPPPMPESPKNLGFNK